MTRVSLTVNDEPVSAEVEPRMHLADFLRETQLLTGTHIGCEHGVCGACTIQIDGAPARSCITLAVACEGADIRTVEGFDDDPVMARLRDAFTKEHALQCGYCTPGMLVSARDIVRRLPDADETRIRQELEGNLCRCTGYVGIVRAVKSVLDLPPVPEPDAATETAIEPEEEEHVPMRVNVTLPDNAIRLTQNIAIAQPAADVWRVFRDIETVASCMPGARLAAPPRDGHVVGRIVAALGPIRATFSGSADIEYDDVNRPGTVLGSGRDNTTGSGAVGEVTFTVRQDGTNATQIQIEIAYSLNGALAQFGRGDLAAGVAQALTNAFAANLEAHLSGGTIDTTAPRSASPACSHSRSAIGWQSFSANKRYLRSTNWYITPWPSFGWTKTILPASISRAPFDCISALAASMSSTPSATKCRPSPCFSSALPIAPSPSGSQISINRPSSPSGKIARFIPSSGISFGSSRRFRPILPS